MIPIHFLRENPDLVVERLSKKNFDASEIVKQIIIIDTDRRNKQKEADELKATSNSAAKEIGALYKAGKGDEANALKEKVAANKGRIKELDAEMAEQIAEQTELLLNLPNLPHDSVPDGKTPEDNVVVRQGGKIPELKNARPHWELADQYGLINFEDGNKLTGAGFPVYHGKGARMQRALLNFFLDENTAAGYSETQPPIVVSEDSARATGQLPDKEGQMYHVQNENLYLIPTAEVPLTNIFRDTLLQDKELPKKMTGYTPCFRREAGSYGKDVRGLNRLHQFDKVEIVQICKPEDSYDALNGMVDHVESILKKLEMPYRILKLCGGDMGFTSALTYDFEVYSTAQEKWLEVSSVSNFENYQANRLLLRYKNANGKNELLHTLNGSALAFPRILASLLENFQDENGIRIPAALQPYCGFDRID